MFPVNFLLCTTFSTFYIVLFGETNWKLEKEKRTEEKKKLVGKENDEE